MTSLFYSNYQNFTPTYTNISLGDGSCDCRYTQRYKSIHVEYKITLGTGFSIGANPTLTLPRPLRNTEQVGSFRGMAHDLDADEYFELSADANTTTSFIIGHIHVDGQEMKSIPITATDPFTFAVGDKITISGTYETA
mgnify:CR=1 FL=1